MRFCSRGKQSALAVPRMPGLLALPCRPGPGATNRAPNARRASPAFWPERPIRCGRRLHPVAACAAGADPRQQRTEQSARRMGACLALAAGFALPWRLPWPLAFVQLPQMRGTHHLRFGPRAGRERVRSVPSDAVADCIRSQRALPGADPRQQRTEQRARRMGACIGYAQLSRSARIACVWCLGWYSQPELLIFCCCLCAGSGGASSRRDRRRAAFCTTGCPAQERGKT